MKWLRIAGGLVFCGGILYAVSLATRDCSVSPYFAVNCLGLSVEQHLGLPSSRLFRAFVLEVAGLILLAGLYLTIRYVFPRRSQGGAAGAPNSEPVAGSAWHDASGTRSAVQTESLILRALCQEAAGGPLRAAAKSLLVSYTWAEPIHQAVFSVVLSATGKDPAGLRAQLPASLTRKGFPDFDFDSLFQPHGLSTGALVRLMERLAQNR